MRRHKRKLLVSIFSLILLICEFSFCAYEPKEVEAEGMIQIDLSGPNISYTWTCDAYGGGSWGSLSFSPKPGYKLVVKTDSQGLISINNTTYTIGINHTNLNKILPSVQASDYWRVYSVTVDWEPYVYNITVNYDNGSSRMFFVKYDTGFSWSNSSNMTYSATTLQLDNSTKAGYHIGGFYTGTNGTGTMVANSNRNLVIPTNYFTSNSTIYAYWVADTYKNGLYYDANGGSGAPGSSEASVTYPNTNSSHTVSSTVPTRAGYNFAGWKTAGGTPYSAGSSYTFSKDYAGAQSATLYAQWSPKSCTNTLNYDSQGGSAVSQQQSTITYPTTSSSFTVAAAPTKAGYNFDGWYTATSGGTPYNPGSTYTINTTNCNAGVTNTLYAHWTAKSCTNTLNYDSQGGSEVSNQTSTITYPTTSSSFTVAVVPTRTGYTFDNWNTNANGTGTKYYPGNTYKIDTTNCDAGVSNTLYAQWTANKYTNTLIYKSTGTTAIDDVTEQVEYPNTKTDFTLTTTIPQSIGYEFIGWYTADGDAGTLVEGTTSTQNSYAGNQTITLYAHWKLAKFNNTLKYNLVGGQNGPADDVREVIHPHTQYEHDVDSTTIPTKEGYTFEAWYDDPEGGNLVTGKRVVGVNDHAGDQEDTLYAHWTPNSYTNTIHYDWGAGTGGPESSSYSVTFPTTYKLIPIDPKVPTMVGHTFSGWFTDDGKQEIGNVILGSEFVADDQEMTLHARYEANVYTNTIKYDTNGGDGQPNDDSHDVTYPDTFYEHTITSKIPTKKGHVFLGWFTDPVGGDQIEGKYTLGESGEVANRSLTLYAHWEVNTFTNTLKYDANGGTGAPDDNSLPVTYPDTQSIHDVDSVTIPERTGYTFGGWYTDKEWTTEAKGTITVGENDGGENQTRTLYAKWDLIEYDITYILHDGEEKLPNKKSYNIESDTFTLHYPERAGYVFGGWTGSNGDVAQLGVTIQKGSIGDRTYEAIWLTEKDIYYKVNYYKMNTDGTTYSLSETNLRLGESGSKVQIEDLIKAYEGFTFEGGVVAPESLVNPKTYVNEATVLGDKSTVINMYYERNKYEVTLEKDSGAEEVLGMGTYFFEEVVSISARMLPGYSFVYWTGTLASTVKDFIFNMPAGPVSLSMRSELNKEASFTVNHYTITKDKKGYELKETETRRNVAESVMKISDLTKSYDEFSFEGGKVADATEVKPDVFDITVTIAGDNSTVINMYYGPKVSSGGGGGGGKAPSIVISDTDPTIKKDENQNADDALKNVQVKNGKIIYVPVPGEIQKEGFKFLGYFYDDKFTKPVKVGDKITGDMNFFAKWEEVEKLTLKKNGSYISGYDDGEFKPSRNMTRAEFCAVIAGLFEEYDEKNMDIYIANDKNFSDVRTDFWYTPYIGFVVSEGIMNGYDAGRFNPNTNTTRAEVCKVLASIFKFENKNVENKFKDELKGQWYEEAVTTLVEAGMINGYDDGTFKGTNNITRAELVILINRITGKTISDEEVEKLDVPFNDLKKTDWYYKDILTASR